MVTVWEFYPNLKFYLPQPRDAILLRKKYSKSMNRQTTDMINLYFAILIAKLEGCGTKWVYCYGHMSFWTNFNILLIDTNILFLI